MIDQKSNYAVFSKYPQLIVIPCGKYDLIAIWGNEILEYVDSTRCSLTVNFPITFEDYNSYGVNVTQDWFSSSNSKTTLFNQRFTNRVLIHALGSFSSGQQIPISYFIVGRKTH